MTHLDDAHTAGPARAAMIRAALCLVLSAGAAEAQGVAIPRQPVPAPGTDLHDVEGMDYRPRDAAVAWTPAGELIVAHTERYASGDVVFEACAGSGLYRVRPGDDWLDTLGTGEPVCRAAQGPAAVAANQAWAVYPVPLPSGSSGLVRVDLATARADTLATGCRGSLDHPAVSPGGQQIAAVGRCGGGEQEAYGLYLMNADGSGLRRLVESVEPAAPTWSPDGRRLVYEHAPGNGFTRLDYIGTDGSDPGWLINGRSPSWSPDGQWIAFYWASLDSGEDVIVVTGADGRAGTRSVFSSVLSDRFERGGKQIREGLPSGPLVWSPDSRRIAFSREYGEGTSLWILDLATLAVQQVTHPDGG